MPEAYNMHSGTRDDHLLKTMQRPNGRGVFATAKAKQGVAIKQAKWVCLSAQKCLTFLMKTEKGEYDAL